MVIVLSPHNDDETLFAAFTVMRERACVVVCHGSSGDYGTTETRMQESAQAVATLGGTLEQWDVAPGDANLLHAKLSVVARSAGLIRAYAPDRHCSHRDHRLLAEVAEDVFRGRLTTYHTYVDGRRVTPLTCGYGRDVRYDPAMVHRKLRALSAYTSQATHPRACQFFLQDQVEWYGKDV